MKIAFIITHHPPTRPSPIIPEAIRLLSEWGVNVDVICPEEQMTDLSKVRVEHDLYVLKSGTELALSMAGILHVGGATILNPYPVAEMLRDKIMTSHILQAAGVPTPDAFVTADPKQLIPLLDDGPIVVKPYRGSQGRGVRVIRTADELNDTISEDGFLFAQRYYEPQGLDKKIYVIGDQVYGVKRVWPPRTYEEKLGEPFTISPDLHEIAIKCGRAFGIGLYGFDVIENNGRSYVVDMSSFPGFKGVPNAALRLADYIYSAGERVLSGTPLFPTLRKDALV
jgi:ribosomal protein S6--L-glutamate ligase